MGSPCWDKNNIPLFEILLVTVSVNHNTFALDDIVEYPSGRFPVHAKVPRPRVEILTLCLQESDLEKPSIVNLIQRE
jgi:hypothetical protein